jgi:catechol 2,3-dioxygenase-like lactoylglutathione lyase family enzyme
MLQASSWSNEEVPGWRGVINHVDLVVADLAASGELYEAALEPLGFRRLYEESDSIGFGTVRNDDFWLRQGPQLMGDRTVGVHLALVATTNAAVDRFFQRAVTQGAQADKPPAFRTEFHEGYYAAFLWGLDRNHIEAVNHNR